MSITTILASITTGLLVSGCWLCPEPEKEYVYQPQKVYIPVECVVPEPECSFKGMSRVEVVDELYRCIKQYKENVKVCQKGN